MVVKDIVRKAGGANRICSHIGVKYKKERRVKNDSKVVDLIK